ncbi:MAG: redoxin family protein [Planctomycetota bacterium]|nr:redoxin family protein [Planctomycetota bacterium]
MTRSTARLALLALLSLSAGALHPRPAQPEVPPGPAADPGERLERLAREDDPDALGVGRIAPDLTLSLLSGERRTLSSLLEGKKGLVIAATSVGCPVSSKYAPRLAALERQFASRAVPVVLLNTVPIESLDDVRGQIRDASFKGPYATDRDLSIARALGARTTAEVFLLDPARRVVYRGAVDDQYAIGAARNAPKRAFLKDAVDALLAGRDPKVRATWAPGCLLEIPPAPGAVNRPAPNPAPEEGYRPAPAPQDVPTYFGRVADIIARNCVECHRMGGVGAFPLDSFPALHARAAMVEAVVRDRLMPPSHGVSTPPGEDSPFAHTRALSVRDRADLLAWLRAGRPAGPPRDLPRTPPAPTTWRIGPPDVLLVTPAAPLPAEGPLLHARRVMVLDADIDHRVGAFELRPVERDSIHHALVWLIPPGGRVPAPDDMPASPQFLGSYGVGDGLVEYPPGAARAIPAGSLLVIDLYARPMGRPMQASLRLAFREAPAPASREVRTLVLAAPEIDLPPGAPDITSRAQTTLERETTVLALWPVMRWRGRALTLRALLPDGQDRTLLDLPAYDARWQIRYALREPLTLPAGTSLTLEGVFDNSASNPSNPEPADHVRLGASAASEALVVAIETLE